MNKVKFTITSILLFIILVLLQVNIFNNLTLFSIVPDIFVIFAIYVSVLSDDEILPGVIVVFTGLMFDICFGNFIGIHSLIGFLISIFTPLVTTKFATETKIGMMLYSFICTFISQIIYGIVYLVINRAIFNLENFLMIVLITSIYNFILTLFIHIMFSGYIKEKDEMYKIVRKY